ncbi:ABC transporter permease [Sporosarcina pasteurii]|uniref:Aliphatic sulfonates transport permease protein ssuC n=1 Tax=Sporosarcina pasteurii TaxID=1474 RepID=A0A380BDP2_SPOPA|nr:ABC transporter permease [Sporosarcina pasteurii]MDS9472824.1 ABC transporter permease [Sporosarcina pasteurii]QBQ06379.1 ABC transporter permease [Sporosarcina pasteurii]SUI98807.1 Putative aliphatic sulfonates transport permease protein ssuC [Sporosarcina pasteurii]
MTVKIDENELLEAKEKSVKVGAELKKVRGFALGFIIPVVLLVVWEAAVRFNLLDAYVFPAPTTILQKIIELAKEGTLWGHVGITFFRVLIGFLAGTVAAVVLGSVVGYFKWFEQLMDPLIQAFRSIPSLAWVPLFILWMGIGEASKVMLIAVGVFFPIYLNIVSGIQGVDRKLIEVGKIYHFTPLQTVRRIIFPASLPSFLVGLRSGVGLGWMFVVAAELMGASQGLGYLLVLGQNTYSPELIIASIILFAIIGKTTDYLLKSLEARALKWQDNLQNQL